MIRDTSVGCVRVMASAGPCPRSPKVVSMHSGNRSEEENRSHQRRFCSVDLQAAIRIRVLTAIDMKSSASVSLSLVKFCWGSHR